MSDERLAEIIESRITAGFEKLAQREAGMDSRMAWLNRLLGGFGGVVVLLVGFYVAGGQSYINSLTTITEKVARLEETHRELRQEWRECCQSPHKPALLSIDEPNHYLAPTDQAAIAATGGPLR